MDERFNEFNLYATHGTIIIVKIKSQMYTAAQINLLAAE